METIRVLVIDDQEIFRFGLRVALKAYRDISLDCEAEDGPAGLALLAERKPDVAIVDVWLPGMDGVEVAEQIRQIRPETRILLVSGCFDDAALNRGIEIGVDGIITKTDPPREFAHFIREIHRGEFCCSPTVLESPFVRLASPLPRVASAETAGTAE